MNYKVSLILPIYNVEKYLNQCIDSIVSQSYENKEIILVNDGSKDNSPSICDEYCQKYNYIKVIHKENGGASSARNEGIKNATGDYVIFIDSDDFIEDDSLDKIMKNINENPVDVAFLGIQKFFSNGRINPQKNIILREFVKGKKKEEVLEYLSILPKYHASPCSKIIKRQLFLDCEDLFFKEGIVAEDIDWCFNLILNAKTFDSYNFNYYYYRQAREGSVTNTIELKNLDDLMYIFTKWLNVSNDYGETEKNFILSELAYEYPIILSFYGRIKNKKKKKYYFELKSNKDILKMRKGRKYKMIYLFVSFWGINTTGKLLNLYLKLR